MVAASHSSDAKTVEEEDLAQTERDHIHQKETMQTLFQLMMYDIIWELHKYNITRRK